MAVTITSPQSAIIARNKFTLAWTHTYPQASYEILYRRKGETAWSTFGKTAGTATSVTIDCSRFDDFVEYQYRVIVYSEYANTTEITYSGSDASAGYAFILVPDSMVGTMKVKYGAGMIEVPLYSTPQLGKQIISIGGDKKTQLIDNTGAFSGSASPVKIRAGVVTRVIPRADKYLSDPGENIKTDITCRTYYSYSYSERYRYTDSVRYKDSGSKSYNDWFWDDAGPFFYSYLDSSTKKYVKDTYYVTAKHYYTDSYTYYYYDYYYYTDYDYYTVSGSGYYYKYLNA